MNKRVKMFALTSALFFSLDTSLLAGGLSGAEDAVGQGSESSGAAGPDAGRPEATERRRNLGDEFGRDRPMGGRGRFESPDRFEDAWESDGTGGFRGIDDSVDRGWRDD